MENDSYGLGLNINENWERNWKDVISTDQDYDGEFLIRLITHKLSLMLNYFRNAESKSKSEEENLPKIIKYMTNCYNLGMKILTYNYGEAADKIFDEYGDPSWFIESSEEAEYIEWDKLCWEAVEARNKDIEKLFRTIGKHINTWWL